MAIGIATLAHRTCSLLSSSSSSPSLLLNGDDNNSSVKYHSITGRFELQSTTITITYKNNIGSSDIHNDHITLVVDDENNAVDRNLPLPLSQSPSQSLIISSNNNSNNNTTIGGFVIITKGIVLSDNRRMLFWFFSFSSFQCGGQ
jgi:hypothetical protein